MKLDNERTPNEIISSASPLIDPAESPKNISFSWRSGRRTKLVLACALLIASFVSIMYTIKLQDGGDFSVMGGGRIASVQGNEYLLREIETYGGEGGMRFVEGVRNSQNERNNSVKLWGTISWILFMAGAAFLFSYLYGNNSNAAVRSSIPDEDANLWKDAREVTSKEDTNPDQRRST